MTMFIRSRAAVCAGLSFTTLAGCATLPTSGPTGAQIYGSQRSADNDLGFEIQELTSIAALPAAQEAGIAPLVPGVTQPSNIVGPNDIIDIAIYEAGVALFSGASALDMTGGAATPAARAERLPGVLVDDEGYITLPYAGRVLASGLTTTQLADLIADALQGRSENPQVIVTLQRSISNSVMVSGEVTRSGRLPLETNRETILDAISLAGGYRGDPSDLIVKIERGGNMREIRLDALQRNTSGEMRVFPGDKITLLRDPESFSVMGAAGQTAQIPFNRPSMSLAEALARSGGSDENQGDPAAIFVFRFVPDQEGGERPVVYHLNMMKAGSYFLAQKFIMRDRDVLFVGNAASNQTRKMVATLGQLFAPFVAVRAITRR